MDNVIFDISAWIIVEWIENKECRMEVEVIRRKRERKRNEEIRGVKIEGRNKEIKTRKDEKTIRRVSIEIRTVSDKVVGVDELEW